MQKAFADFFKPELPKQIKTCAVDNFVTSKLFGDDLWQTDQRKHRCVLSKQKKLYIPMAQKKKQSEISAI